MDKLVTIKLPVKSAQAILDAVETALDTCLQAESTANVLNTFVEYLSHHIEGAAK